MHILEKVKIDIAKKINKTLDNIKVPISSEAGIGIPAVSVGTSDFVYPPNPEMGELSLPCFNLSVVETRQGASVQLNPVETAQYLAKKLKLKKPNPPTPPKSCDGINLSKGGVYASVQAVGPYLNFILDFDFITKNVLKTILKQKERYGRNKMGGKKKIMIEFAHPNTHKAFHVGHLRNIITGETIVRIMESCGYKVIRANFQGDIGLHIAKCLWGINSSNSLRTEYERLYKINTEKSVIIKNRAEFLGHAYAEGSVKYETDENAKKEIIELNKKIYIKDKSVLSIYKKTRKWSLEYFSGIYKRVDSKFDRLYFESEVFEAGRKLVLENLEKGIFRMSDNAVIFEGEKYGLHNRVFINSEGNPTYEAKDMGLAQLQFKEYNPDKIMHVVALEQSEYFKVVFKALEMIMPKSKDREFHLVYGWVRLKEGKMSSRLGKVVLGEWLLDGVKKEIIKIVEKNDPLLSTTADFGAAKKDILAEKIALAAVKYSFLKSGINKDIAFDINESISLSGNSGPYLQYTYARINSIVRKAEITNNQTPITKNIDFGKLNEQKEHSLIIKLAKFPEIVEKAGTIYDPSEIAKYLFELAQIFNDFYHSVNVLNAEDGIKQARLALLISVNYVIKNGLYLLGIDTVEEM